VVDKGNSCNCCCSIDAIPEYVHNSVRGQIVEAGGKDLVVSLGIFALIRLERTTQVVIPCSDVCIPERESSVIGEEDPCQLFKKMKFPMNEFFPPSLNNMAGCEDICDTKNDRVCARK
jgi:hypothetical protein